jgi:hypothetical protein
MLQSVGELETREGWAEPRPLERGAGKLAAGTGLSGLLCLCLGLLAAKRPGDTEIGSEG